ncbi:MAG: hypothetical protein KKB37_12080 [Alphaproteobacteria bacterium]|nr:hypothetical protein [Alphaproteobacteria bacterium]
MTTLSHSGVARLFLWMYAVPVLGFWAMLSFLPLAGVPSTARPRSRSSAMWRSLLAALSVFSQSTCLRFISPPDENSER